MLCQLELFGDRSHGRRSNPNSNPNPNPNPNHNLILGAVAIAQGFTWNGSDPNEGYSEAQCLMCTPGTMQCSGGFPWLCMKHIIENGGIDSEKDWPYIAWPDCNAAKEKYEKVAMIESCSNITADDEQALRAALAITPVSVGINAQCDSFMNYGGGVLSDDCGGGKNQIDHAVLAVGYDQADASPYYIVKNSWGNSWGEDGYVRMKMGSNLDCIACKATYPTASKQVPPKPLPEVACPTGTFNPKSDFQHSCPQGTTCCCSRKSLFFHHCKETQCCMKGQTCDDGHGCK